MIKLTLQFEVTLKEKAQKELAELGSMEREYESFAQTLARETIEFWHVHDLVDDSYEPKMVVEVL